MLRERIKQWQVRWHIWQKRLGVYPFFVVGSLLAVGGGFALYQLSNFVWLFDVEQRLDLLRAVPLGRTDPAALWDASLTPVVLTFLGAMLITVMGGVMPLVFYLNKRFGQSEVPGYILTIRQSFLIGFWVAICVLLQMNRTLGMAVAVLVGLVLIIFELLLQIRVWGQLR
ncbi:MAG TPA: hypothetical protein VLL52_01760 [Anaerolineae bacterium]|nr:hypothetical protein [Anaerolineae bacterium]